MHLANIIKNYLIKVLLVLPVFYISIAHADVNPVHQTEISYLKSYITESTCIFTRNNVNYKGSEAITHINRKEDYFKKQINTAEDFIRLAATRSELSKKKYTVTCTEGHTENLDEWLLKLLKTYRTAH